MNYLRFVFLVGVQHECGQHLVDFGLFHEIRSMWWYRLTMAGAGRGRLGTTHCLRLVWQSNQ